MQPVRSLAGFPEPFDLETGLLEKIAALIAPGVAIERGEGQAIISRDSEILEQLLQGSNHEPAIRLWVNHQCLVTTAAVARKKEFVEACQQAELWGWPVHVRASGGSTIVHRPGILNISLFQSGEGLSSSLGAAYQSLTGILVSALGALGIHADTGPVPGCYCDGQYNVRVKGRRIAGTACHRKNRGERYAQVLHAAMLVSGDLQTDMDIVSRFERLLGIDRCYAADACRSIEMVLALDFDQIAASQLALDGEVE